MSIVGSKVPMTVFQTWSTNICGEWRPSLRKKEPGARKKVPGMRKRGVSFSARLNDNRVRLPSSSDLLIIDEKQSNIRN